MNRKRKKKTKQQMQKQREYALAHYYRNREEILEKLKLERLLKRLGDKIENIEEVKEKYDKTWQQIHRLKGER